LNGAKRLSGLNVLNDWNLSNINLVRCNTLILLLALIAALVQPLAAADKLRIGYGAPSVAMSVLWITKEGRLFEKNGLDVEVLYLESALVQRALIAGNIAFGEMTGSLMSAPKLQGADLVMVAGFLNKLLYRLIARPEIASPADLKGKRVGVSRFGAASNRRITKKHRKPACACSPTWKR
jgi:ABC-type nitrate/sulfonate/bicarbonate transport system substrate-binding protein